MSAQQKWNGMCPAGKHGLDYEGQPCDECAPPEDCDFIAQVSAGAISVDAALQYLRSTREDAERRGWVRAIERAAKYVEGRRDHQWDEAELARGIRASLLEPAQAAKTTRRSRSFGEHKPALAASRLSPGLRAAFVRVAVGSASGYLLFNPSEHTGTRQLAASVRKKLVALGLVKRVHPPVRSGATPPFLYFGPTDSGFAALTEDERKKLSLLREATVHGDFSAISKISRSITGKGGER